MGLFDFFKKKKDKTAKKKVDEKPIEKQEIKEVARPKDVQAPAPPTDQPNTRASVEPVAEAKTIQLAMAKKYGEYIVRFVHMQQQGNYSPIAVFENPDGSLTGFLYMIGEDTSYSYSVEESIFRMAEEFDKRMQEGRVLSYATLYHSQFDNNDNHAVAHNEEEFKALTTKFKTKQEAGFIDLLYTFSEVGIAYSGINGFSPEATQQVFDTKLKENFDYFQEKVNIIPEMQVNEIGIKVKKVNNGTMYNTWAGMLGFETYQNSSGQLVTEHYALVLCEEPKSTRGEVMVKERPYQDIVLRSVQENETPTTLIPVIKTKQQMPVENLEISDWVNTNGLEAVITGRGRDEFMVKYYATDFAENRDLYLTQKKHDIKLSGIAYVLDKYKKNPETKVDFSEDFATYMPNNELFDFGCFDFIGDLLEFKKVKFLEGGLQSGYMLKVKLINHPDKEDFFNIVLFANPENMRFDDLEVGMKLTGMFQIQGEMA